MEKKLTTQNTGRYFDTILSAESFQKLKDGSDMVSFEDKTQVLQFRRKADPNQIVTLKFQTAGMGNNGQIGYRLVNEHEVSPEDIEKMYGGITGSNENYSVIPNKEIADTECSY